MTNTNQNIVAAQIIREKLADRDLPTTFTLTIHEFSDKHVINSLQADSRFRGFNCDNYSDDPEFLDDLALAAVNDESNASTSAVQSLLNFLYNGDLTPEIEVSDAHIIGGGYSVDYTFTDVNWETFNMVQAIEEARCDGEEEEEFIDNIVGLFDEI